MEVLPLGVNVLNGLWIQFLKISYWYEETIPLFEKHDIVIDWSDVAFYQRLSPNLFCKRQKDVWGEYLDI